MWAFDLEMRTTLYGLAVLLVATALMLPSSVQVQPEQIETCHMCSATRMTTRREIKTILPFFSRSTTVIAGGDVSCQHWWRNPQQTGSTRGFTIGNIAVLLRIVLALGAVALVGVTLRIK